MDEVIVSVAICTRSRAESLARTLESLCAMRCVLASDYEVVVVDNGSTDHTATVCKAFEARLPMRYFFEQQPGLSVARNRAIREVRGRYICWTDDDVTVCPGWLHAYLTSFAKHPEAAFFGGKITPVLEEPATPWFAQNYRSRPLQLLVALRDLGAEEVSLGDANKPFGANYAIRMDVQRRYPYDPELGVQPGRNRVGEETAVIQAMIGAGLTGYWVPAAEVVHHISRKRQSTAYVERYFRAVGETDAYLWGRSGRVPVLGVPASLWCRYAVRLCAYYWARAVRKPKVWLLRLRDLGFVKGQFEYHWCKRSTSRIRDKFQKRLARRSRGPHEPGRLPALDRGASVNHGAVSRSSSPLSAGLVGAQAGVDRGVLSSAVPGVSPVEPAQVMSKQGDRQPTERGEHREIMR